MNLPPAWAAAFRDYGWQAVHWSEVGKPDAEDRFIMEWADAEGYIVFTHDLDFGALLAATGASGPSVIQLRTQDPTPEAVGKLLFETLEQLKTELASGALISLDPERARVRILPIQRGARSHK